MPGLKAEFLPAPSCFIHQAPFGTHKNGHSIIITGLGLNEKGSSLLLTLYIGFVIENASQGCCVGVILESLTYANCPPFKEIYQG
jgi:hypothetical protein